MIVRLSLILSALFGATAFAETFSKETGGFCNFDVAAYSDQGIWQSLARTNVRFEFPQTHSFFFKNGLNDKAVGIIGIGTAAVDAQIQTVDSRRRPIVKPVQIRITIALGPDGASKTLTASINMYDVLKGRQNTLRVAEAFQANRNLGDQLGYFSAGFPAPAPRPGEIIGSSVFCHFDPERQIE